MSSDVSSPAGAMDSSSANKTSKEVPATKYRCNICPYVAKSTGSLENHAKNHVLNPDAEFVCRKCPFYCSSKIELGIHSMVHAMQRQTLDKGDEIPEKRLKVDTQSVSKSPPQAKSRMSPFKKASSLSPTQKSLKKTTSTSLLKQRRRDSVDSAGRVSPTKGLWKVKLRGGSPSPALSGTKKNSGQSEDQDDAESVCSTDSKGNKKRNSIVAATCPLCPQTFTLKGNMTKHQKYHEPSPDRPHKCSYCSFSCASNSSLNIHIGLHLEALDKTGPKYAPEEEAATLEDEDESGEEEEDKEDGKYKCEKCPYTTIYKRLIKVHRKQHFPSADRQARCPHCPYYVTVKYALARHLAVHKDELSDVGSRRDSVSTTGTLLDEFLNSDDNADDKDSVVTNKSDEEKSKKKTLSCDICPYTTGNIGLMETHKAQHTPSLDRPVRCEYCPYYVSARQALWKHMVVHKEYREKKEQYEKIHNEAASTNHGKVKEELMDDDEEYGEEMNLPPLENETSEANESGNDSEEVVEDSYSEDDDDEDEGSDTDMEVDNEDKPEEKIYACSICPYTTPHRRLIRDHMSKHAPSPSRQARCDYCPYYGQVKSLLKKHMLVHQEYRDLTGADADSLNKDETEFKCERCPYETTSNSSLKRHIEFHSSSEERQVKCPYCQYFVRSQARLANHMVLHKEHHDKDQQEILNSSPVPREGTRKNHAKAQPVQKLPKAEKETKQSAKDQEKKLYSCPICPYQGYDVRNFYRHKNLHTPSEERKVKCNYCPFYVNSKSGLVHHLPLHIGGPKKEESSPKPPPRPKVIEGSHSCPICPYTTDYPSELKKHRAHHTPRPEWQTKCRFCPFYAANFNGISRHIPLHAEYQAEKSSPKKPEDNKDSPNKQKDKMVSPGKQKDKVASPSKQKEKLVSPKKQEVKDEEDEEMENGEEEQQEDAGIPYHYRCALCPYVGQPNKLRKHMEMHSPSEKRQAKCPYCPFYVKSSASLGSHLHIHNKTKGDDDDVIQFKNIHDNADENVSSEGEAETDEDSGNEHDEEDGLKARKAKVNKYQCHSCPYVARKPELELHLMGHKPNAKNIYQCHYCSFAHANKSALNSHFKVHQPDYLSTQMAQYKVHLDINQMGDFAPASPAKSDISDVSDCDVLEMANIKQQLITAKIISAPVSKTRFKSEYSKDDGDHLIEGLMVDKDGKMKLGLFKTMFKCKHCPYASIHQEQLQKHDQNHSQKTGKYKCSYCSYKSDHKILRNRHTRVHAYQYVPGAKDINDYECKTEEETDEGEDEEEDMEVSFKETPAEDDESKKEEDKSKADTSNLSKAAIKSPDGNSIKIKSKPILSMNDLPVGLEYYVRQDRFTGQSYLERASVKKWCCEKCPYSTMDKDWFENHSMLHASHQRNVCEFCDYSVPVYNFLLEHRKLHLQPNPNLLAMQSVTNLLNLPEVPADVAAAVNFPGETHDPISRYGTHDHMGLYENSNQYTEPRKLYHCDRCPYTNVRRDNLLAHMRFHMTKSELKCDYCDYSVDKHELLIQHIRVHFVDPDTIKLDVNSNPVISAPTEDVPPPSKTVLRDSTKMNTKSSDKSDKSKAVKKDSMHTTNNGDADADDMNNNGSNWICQYCDRAFSESDRLMRHEMQHLIGQHI